jgi:hypothetical protein
MLTTPSEHARHARAELEVIIAALRLSELTRLLELGRQLLEETGEPRASAPEPD